MVDRKGAIDGDETDDREEGISTGKNASVASSSALSSLACKSADATVPELPRGVERQEDADMMAIKMINTGEMKRKNKAE